MKINFIGLTTKSNEYVEKLIPKSSNSILVLPHEENIIQLRSWYDNNKDIICETIQGMIHDKTNEKINVYTSLSKLNETHHIKDELSWKYDETNKTYFE